MNQPHAETDRMRLVLEHSDGSATVYEADTEAPSGLVLVSSRGERVGTDPHSVLKDIERYLWEMVVVLARTPKDGSTP